jgi:hypothetical protein
MPATPRQVNLPDEKDRPGDYSTLEGEYEALLIDVEDIEATTTDNYGWGFVFQVKGLPIKTRVWLKGGGMWKVREVFNALGSPIAPGEQAASLNPNTLVGRSCVVNVVREKDRNGALDDKGEVKTYAAIAEHTPIVKVDDVTTFADFS